MPNKAASGDAIPAKCALIEVHVRELGQLFNMIDPSSFHDRDLDPNAEQFIESWAKELPRGAPLALLVHLDRPSGSDDAAVLRDSVRQFFGRSADAARRRLRELFRRGRISLIIALAFMIALSELSRLLTGVVPGRFGDILREGLLIGGWVAMWRPIEVFLYDWWPIRAQARLYDRLAAMPVRIEYSDRT
ncbi:MAG: hypothetical protein ACREMN_08185 [Gemmatimonadales bacterium]